MHKPSDLTPSERRIEIALMVVFYLGLILFVFMLGESHG